MEQDFKKERFVPQRIHKNLRAILAQIALQPEKLPEIFATTTEALVAFDENRLILFANKQAEVIFGYAPGELKGRPTHVLIPERLRQPAQLPMMAVVDLMQVELPGLMRDGSEREVEWCFGSIYHQGSPIFVTTVRDRGALDLALEALRASEERFHLLVNSVQDTAIFMLDRHARISSWNPGATRIKGWTIDEALGQPYQIFFTPEDRAVGMPGKIIRDAIANGSREVIGWRMRKDGTRFWAHGSLTALRDVNGVVSGFVKITRDLTERRRAEENERRLEAERIARGAAQDAEKRVRASEKRIRRLQQMTAALSKAVRPEEILSVFLHKCLDSLGATAGAVFLLSADKLQLSLLGHRGYPEELASSCRSLPIAAQTPMTFAVRQHTAVFYESHAECADPFPSYRDFLAAGNCEALAVLPLIAHGEWLGVLNVHFNQPYSFHTDNQMLMLMMADFCSQAFERARLFEAERVARASAELASRSKDEFLAMLSHELRNPMASINTAVQLLRLRGDDRIAVERDVIERQLSHLSKLVDDLFDVSRVTQGSLALSCVPSEISGILASAVEMTGPYFKQRAQHLDLSIPKTDLMVHADPFRLAQVIANLLTNASKYTPLGGHVWLSGERENETVVIRVRDDGQGIAPDLLPNLFDLFVQGPQTGNRPQSGLGVGLALVKSIVTLHGGTVEAKSPGLGRGSELIVRIPALSRRAPHKNEDLPSQPPAPKERKRILVIDDNVDASEMLAELLRELGHDVDIAHDGLEALRQLEAKQVEVAILDLGLPFIDGLELARRVCKRRAGSRPRLIALTGYGGERAEAQSRAVGFDVHLVKPVDMSALVAALESDVVPSQEF